MIGTPVIVVTGGIASGKTTVAKVLAERGGMVVDCDRLAHRVYRDREIRDELRRIFGKKIFDNDGKVSHSKLGTVVFSNAGKLKKLNQVVHPKVTEVINRELSELMKSYRYLVLDAVLFFQYKFNFEVNLVVVTEASERERLQRLIKRDRLSQKEGIRRIKSQRCYYDVWSKAEVTINTEQPLEQVKKVAASVRDNFLDRYFQDREE